MPPQAIGGLTAQLLAAGLIIRTTGRPGRRVAFTITDAGVDTIELASTAAETLDMVMLRLLRPDVARVLDDVSRHVLARLT